MLEYLLLLEVRASPASRHDLVNCLANASVVPDFRSSTGLFTTLRGQHKLKASGKHLFDASVYKHDSSTTSFHTMVRGLAQLTAEAQPTNFHHMLASIAEEGRLMRLYTQNIDSIDTQMPPLATNVPLNTKGPWPVTIQLHGGLEKMVCTKCGHLEPFNASLFEGPEAPLCKKCEEQDQVRTAFAGKRSHGIGRLRPRIVLYNEYNPDEEAIGNVSKADLRRVPDVVLVVGTSLKIPGVRRIVKEMCQLTRSKRDGITAWINTDPEPQGAEFKDCWDFVVRGKCDDFAELVNLPRWDQQDIGERDSYMVTGDETKEQRYQASVSRDRIEVPLERKRKSPSEDIIPSSQDRAQASTDLKSKLAGQTQGGIPTPGASPKLRNPLPLTKPAGRGRPPKQSTLIFNGNVKESTPAPVPEVPKAKRKPRQSKKKEPAKPRNTLNNAFKATKAVASDGKKNLQKQASVDIELPDMSSRVDLANGLSSTLPSLRPMNKVKTPTALKSESLAIRRGGQISPFATSSPPTTPVTDTITSPKTISPTSKPRAMGHLID